MAKNRDKVLREAERLVRKNKVEQAVELYEKGLKSNPNDPNLLNRIGDLYGQLGEVDKAVELYLRIADYFAEDGFLSKAIAILKKINRAAPGRLDVFERLAELYLRQGLVVEAKNQLERLAGWHRENGDLEEAIRVHQRLLQIDPDNHVVHLRLADLLMEQGQQNEALEVYDRLGTMLLDHGRLDEADRLYGHVLESRPQTGLVFVPIIEALCESGRYPRAREYCEAAWKVSPGARELAIPRVKILLAVGEGRAAADLAEKMLEKHGEDLDVRAVAGRAFLGIGEGGRAKELLLFSFDEMLDRGELEPARELAKELLKALPNDAEVLERAVRAFKGSDNEEMVHTLRAALADAYFRLQRSDQARELYMELARERPKEVVYQDRLRKLARGEGPEADIDSQEEPVPAALEEPETPPAPEAAEPEFDPQERFAEANVFAKYGLVEKAVQHLEVILETYPDYHQAREKLVLLLVEQGATGRAAEVGGLLREHYEEIGAHDRLAALESSIGRKLKPAKEAETPVETTTGAGTPVTPSEMEPGTVAGGEVEVGQSEDDEVLIIDLEADKGAELDGVGPPTKRQPEDQAEDLEAEPPPVSVGSEEEDEGVVPTSGEAQSEMDEPTGGEALVGEDSAQGVAREAKPKPGVEASPDEVDALLSEAGIDVARGTRAGVPRKVAAREPRPEIVEERPQDGEEPAEERIEQVEPPAEAGPGEMAEAVSTAAEWDHSTVEREPGDESQGLIELEGVEGPPLKELEQVDFYMAQGLYEDAIRMLDGLEEDYQGHEELAQRRLELKKRGVLLDEVEEAPREAVDELFSEEDEYVDLAEELEQEFAEEDRMVEEATGEGQDEALLEEVFQEFQKGVAEQLSEEDSDTHFNLGIAYKEMGLLPEAIKEFQIADNDPDYRTESCSMIALCYLEQGLPGEAVQWYRRVLEGGDVSGEARLGLLYDLASALEQAGELEEARASLEEIAAVDPDFRDVDSRLESLDEQRQVN